MKKIVLSFISIFTLLAFFTLLCLPAPLVFALDETQIEVSEGEYTQIESDYLSTFLALDFFDALYVTDGQKVIKRTDTEITICRNPQQNNKFYNIAVNENSIFSAQEGLTIKVFELTSTETENFITIDSVRKKDSTTDIQIEGSKIKKVACDEFNNTYAIIDDYIAKVSFDKTNNQLVYYLDYTTQLSENKAFTGGGFCINEDGDTMYYSIDNNVYKVVITQTIVEIEPEITDLDDTDTTIDANSTEGDENSQNEENTSQNDTPTQIIETDVEIFPLTLTEFNLNTDNSFLSFKPDSTIKSLRIDNIGNLYVLSTYPVSVTDSTNTVYSVNYSTLYKCNLKTKKADKIDYNFEIADICYDFCTGSTYAVINEPQMYEGDYVCDSNGVITLNKLVNLNTHGLVTNYTALTEKNYADFINHPTSEACVTLANIADGTIFYDYCSLKMPKSISAEDKTVIILGEDTYNHYYYVLDTNFALAPFYKLAYVPIKHVLSTFTPTQTGSTESKIIVARARLYNLPNSVIIKKTDSSITYAPHCGVLNRDMIVTVINLDSSLPFDHNSTPFVLVSTQIDETDVLVYMDKRTLISITEDTSLRIIHTSNATMRVDTPVFTDDTCQVEKDHLIEGDKVTVLSKRHGIAKIQYYVGNEIKTGFVNKDLVDDGSLTTAQFIGLMVAITCVIIAIVVAIIIRVKAKKRRA
ncbi:MAG: hypothetical protein IKQ31_02825 [Clostridia bacterium]|nr:hypothetical protein [Clostridia bacterium]